MDRRTRARELAMQALFQLDVQGKDALDILEKFLKDNSEDDLVRNQARTWAYGTWEKLADCDTLIKKAASHWQLDRISAVERNILRISVYQLAYCLDIPKKVVINEGIEMAKRFSTAQSGKFVNGVLDAVRKELENQDKPEEQ